MVVYKITNKLTGKIYIGQDSKNNPEYYGSGLLIKRALDKYGKENFIKEILCRCKTKEELCESEIQWIAYYRKKFPSGLYNISSGGEWGDTLTHHPDKDKICKKIGAKNKKHAKWRKENLSSEEMIEKYSRPGDKNGMYGKNHSQKAKDAVSKANKGRLVGEKNPKFIQITEEQRKKIIQLVNKDFFIKDICRETQLSYRKVKQVIKEAGIDKNFNKHSGEKNPNWRNK